MDGRMLEGSVNIRPESGILTLSNSKISFTFSGSLSFMLE